MSTTTQDIIKKCDLGPYMKAYDFGDLHLTPKPQIWPVGAIGSIDSLSPSGSMPPVGLMVKPLSGGHQ